MAVYKIPQDVEADDKFVGPLSFKQFIFAGIAVVSAYLSFISLSRGFWPAVIFLFPFILVGGFLGFPWGRDQPTEIWLAARIRFFIKPRVRIWNQAGAKELVTVTAPKKIEKLYTDGLSSNEVTSRLSGLATLLDSRGWAVKNMTSDVYASPISALGGSDRLLDMSALPQQVTENITGADVLDESHNTTALNFDQMIKNSEDKHRQDIMQKMQAVRQQPDLPLQALAPPADFWYLQNQAGQQQAIAQPTAQQQAPTQQNADFWFLQQQGSTNGQARQPSNVSPTVQPPKATIPAYTTFQAPAVVSPYSMPSPQTAAYGQTSAEPSLDEAALLEKLHKHQNESFQQYGHLKTIQPLSEQSAPVVQQFVQTTPPPMVPIPVTTNYTAQPQPPIAPKQVTPPVDAAIINLANNDDLNVATLARQANKEQAHLDDNEVVISLH